MRTTIVRVVAINDVYELVNLPKLHTFLKQLKRRGTPATAVVLAGDFLSPSMLSSLDGGRGMVSCLRAAGVTHACLGNHEADLRLPDLRARLQELSKSTTLLNTNVNNFQHNNSNILDMTVPHATIFAPRKDSRQNIELTMMGFLSDEANMFRDGTFRGLPIANVLDTFSTTYQTLHPTTNVVLPVTHQSMTRDRDLAHRMLEEMKLTTSSYCHPNNHGGTKGIILGGHEHEPMDETVTDQESSSSIRILKTGSDARLAALVEWTFDHTHNTGDHQSTPPALVSVDAEFVDLSEYANSPSVQTLVNRKMSVLERMENQIMVHNDFQKENVCLSSVGTRLSQTSVGSFFCMAMQEELDADAAILNGAVLKGDSTYPDNIMSYADLRKELPFPTKMVVVPMTRKLLREAILFSRTQLEDQPTTMEGKESSNADTPAQIHGTEGDGIARRGYLQVSPDFCIHGNDNEDDTDTTQIQVALPRNLLSGFCRIKPLVNLGEELKASGTFPEEDDFVPALDLVTRYCCKNRWLELSSNISRFEDMDMNRDGVLDRHEVKIAMTSILGTAPEPFFVDKMIDAIDQDGNGVIDEADFNVLLSMIEHRDQN